MAAAKKSTQSGTGREEVGDRRPRRRRRARRRPAEAGEVDGGEGADADSRRKRAGHRKAPASAKAPAKAHRRPRRRAATPPADEAGGRQRAGRAGDTPARGHDGDDGPQIPAPRGTTKDGIAYTKDFDVKFLKAQKDSLLDRARVKLVGQADPARGRGELADRGRRDGRRAVRRRERRGRHDGRRARARPGAVGPGPPDRRRHRRRARAASPTAPTATPLRLGPADPAGAPRGDPVGDRARRGEGRRASAGGDAR